MIREIYVGLRSAPATNDRSVSAKATFGTEIVAVFANLYNSHSNNAINGLFYCRNVLFVSLNAITAPTALDIFSYD